MNSTTLTIEGWPFDVEYNFTKGMKSNSYDEPDDDDEYEIYCVEYCGINILPMLLDCDTGLLNKIQEELEAKDPEND